MSTRNVKIVTVGDGACGKTSLLFAYVHNTFNADYVPTVFDNLTTYARVDDVTVSVSLWDTAGQEDYDRLRPLSYPETDLFLLCYSIFNRTSFDNLKAKWYPEVTHHCPTHTLLVANKIDLRQDPERLEALSKAGQKVVTTQEGLELVKDLPGCVGAMECSALLGRGVNEVFNFALKTVVGQVKKEIKLKPAKKKHCTLL
eukprot:TRINITY_DN213_c0_g7_i1.p1 TRINITY_DN213_c0_g7~~TRINITY_DN213_c0_g7_i1.p1  ORF type:complete len:200 (-),score=31.44 TRINITY_DN213_c0_g7_i1:114-713(-)